METENYITGTIRIDPILPNPYILEFEYKGNEELKERISNISEHHKHCLYLRSRFFLKDVWTIDEKARIDHRIHLKIYDVSSLITKQIHISFQYRKKADESLLEIELLLNKYLKHVQNEYERLLLELEKGEE